MGRTILNALPEWLLFIVFAGGSAVVCVSSLLLVRRFIGIRRTLESSHVLVGVSAIVMTLFSLFIAFAVLTLDASFRGASDSVQSEANSLTQIVQDMRVFPAPARLRVDDAVRAYANEVRGHEFAAMRNGDSDPATERAFNRLVAAVQSIQPSTGAQRAFYGSAVTALDGMLEQRHQRLAAATGSLPQAFWVLIFLTAATGLATTLLLKAETLATEVLMLGAVAIVVGAGILTILLLDYPFSGSVSVSNEPFADVLAHLPAGAR
jgi:Protein of unknown function (DUF4239)